MDNSTPNIAHPHSVGAIVVGGDYQGLGIVRSLGRRNIPVCVIDDEHSIAKYSRYTKHYIRTCELKDQNRTVEQVIEVGSRLGLQGWVLFPTREETVAAFAHHRSELSRHFRVPTPCWEVVRWAWDKRQTYARAGELGIPVPTTWRVASPDELSKLPIRYPVAIKPAIKEHFIYATKVKAWRANNEEELMALFERAAAQVGHGEVMIQDFIPGDGRDQFAYCALFKNGKALGSVTVKRNRQHPAEFGKATTYAETVDMPEVKLLSESFLRSINYYGLVELEYKRDSRDGLMKLIDVNPRTWGYHSIGSAAGVDFPYMLFSDQIGTTFDRQHGKVGIRWIRIVTDLPTAFLGIVNGRLRIRDYLRSLCKVDTEAVFCWDDPMPGLAELGMLPYLYLKRGF